VRHIRAAIARLRGLFVSPGADDELREELEAHLEMETAEYIRRGMAPDAARRRALIASGGLTQAAEAVREQRGVPWVNGVVADLRYALRALRHSPAFTIVVIVTLALGVGANTAIFSVVRAVALKALPHDDSGRLVYLRQSTDGQGNESLQFSVPEVRDLRQSVPSLAAIAEYAPWFHTLQRDDLTIRLDVALVSGNFFEVMGLGPALGRLIRPTDDGVGATPVMVLTHELWTTVFGRDTTIVGRSVRIDERPVTVVGVLERAPFFPHPVDAILNMAVSSHHTSAMMVEGRTHRMTEVFGRLAAGATLEGARAEVDAVHARMRGEFKDAYDPGSHYMVAVIPFREALTERAELTLWLLIGAAAFVLIIAAANVANLTLMRGVRREPELILRSALGAKRGRLRRLLLVENLVLAAVGTAFGLVIALNGVGLLASLVARYSPRAGEIRLDAAVLAFAVMLAIALAVVLSVIASLPKEGTLAATIAGGMRRVSGSLRNQRLQRALVVAQVAVSVVLLAGAGLLTRTMIRLASVDTGLVSQQVLTLQMPLVDPSRFDPTTDGATKELYQRLQREVRAIPGVLEVGVGSTMPLRSSLIALDVKAEGRATPSGEAIPQAELRTASAEYFRASGIPLVQGRLFAATDRAGATRVAIVNEAFVSRVLGGSDPIGKRFAFTGDVLRFTPFSAEWRTIVGVARNTQDGGLDAPPRPVAFVPFDQELTVMGGLVIRADGGAQGLHASAMRVARRLAPGVPIEDALTIEQIKDESIAPRRLNAALVSAFGILAVVIAAVGLAGVLAFSVSARTSEIGIRMSLGADAGRIERMVLREGAGLLLAGLAIGAVGAWLAARAIRGLLFGVEPHDPVTLAGVTLMMALIGILACWIPAVRASRIDPAITMRL